MSCFDELKHISVKAELRSQFCETMSLAWEYFGGQLAPNPYGYPEA